MRITRSPYRIIISMVLGMLTALVRGGIAPAVAQSEGQIGGIVYEDKNGNGIREEGEEGIKNVEITFDSGGWSTTISTADNGAFSLAVNPATWTVTVNPPAGYTTPRESVEVFIENPGDAVTNIEFGLVRTRGEGGEVLPASGGAVSEGVIVGGLVGVLLVGIVLVVTGQVRSRRQAP